MLAGHIAGEPSANRNVRSISAGCRSGARGMNFQIVRIPLPDGPSQSYAAIGTGVWRSLPHGVHIGPCWGRCTGTTERPVTGGNVDSETTTALISAGAAVGGGLVTGWFTFLAAKRQVQGALDAAARQADAAWAAGQRQADAAWEAGRQQAAAAWEAGRLQADAQLSVAGQTLNAQALAAQREVRRAAYVTFLGRADTARHLRNTWQTALGTADATPRRREYSTAMAAVLEALNVVRLEGPDAVTIAAEALHRALDAGAAAPDAQTAHSAFLTAARTALTTSP